VPELDERDERLDPRANALELRECLGGLLDPRVVLSSSGSIDVRNAANASSLGSPSCQVIDLCALTWKTNSGGVRCAQRPVTAGSGR
jgi:hypothetical protein